ncbi:MAG: DUF3348 domain-containing protein [Betaproteobacteria bacterium]|nr:MAG: DUF3348 domain-containing protein [Betaproteobacteria bacterium]
MAQGLPRTHLNSAGLVRALATLAEADVADSRQSLAERLGDWLDFTQALALFSALNAAAGEPGAAAATPAATPAAAARRALAHVRAVLTESIASDGASRAGRSRIDLPVPAAQATAEQAADFEPWRRYYLAHQRDMNANIGPLRASVRTALSRQSATLARLAALDAVMDEALAERERALLATVPALLKRRFAHRLEAHRATRAGAQAQDDPAAWMQHDGWLAAFCAELKTVLLAELELRLQPVAGLIEALDNEMGKQQ